MIKWLIGNENVVGNLIVAGGIVSVLGGLILFQNLQNSWGIRYLLAATIIWVLAAVIWYLQRARRG
jgi:hypothetical protein